MNSKNHSIRFKAKKYLKGFITKKINDLVRFNESLFDSDVIITLDNNEPGGNKIREILVIIPDHDLFTKKQYNTFEDSSTKVAKCQQKQTIKIK